MSLIVIIDWSKGKDKDSEEMQWWHKGGGWCAAKKSSQWESPRQQGVMPVCRDGSSKEEERSLGKRETSLRTVWSC